MGMMQSVIFPELGRSQLPITTRLETRNLGSRSADAQLVVEALAMEDVEMAPDKAIVSSAIDAALAFVLQVEEIVRSTGNEVGARNNDLEVDPSQPSSSNGWFPHYRCFVSDCLS